MFTKSPFTPRTVMALLATSALTVAGLATYLPTQISAYASSDAQVTSTVDTPTEAAPPSETGDSATTNEAPAEDQGGEAPQTPQSPSTSQDTEVSEGPDATAPCSN